MIRRVLLGSVCMLGLIGAASAADLPGYAPAPAPYATPVFSWTGFYLGANVGFDYNALTVNDRDYFDGLGDNTTHSYGVIGGGQIGYNWQAGSLVYGLEADFQGLSNRRTDNNDVSNGDGLPYAQIRSQLDELATVRGRVGIAIDRALIYATGGLAYAHTKDAYNDVYSNVNYGDDATWNSNGWRPGFVVGGGVEWKLTNTWSMKTEALYYNLAEHTVSKQPYLVESEGENTDVYRQSFTNQGVIMRVGLNYKW